MKRSKISIFWFRRDLRLEDNAGLYHALSSGYPVLPIFIFDKNILDKLSDKNDRRIDYIHQALTHINSLLKLSGSTLKTYYGSPLDIFKQLMNEFEVQEVFCNRDYEPRAIERDNEINQYLHDRNIQFKTYKDQVIFDQFDIIKNNGTPYTIYTPYSKKWKEKLMLENHEIFNPDIHNFYQQTFSEIHSLDEIGFKKTEMFFVPPKLDAAIIDDYDKYRDYPALQKTSMLGIALRFGTISIRSCVSFAIIHNQTWLSELIWREFFMQILYHFPSIENHSFKRQYDFIAWRNDESEFDMWCNGKTGFPLVDAGMRQLNETGYMHNRVRMVVAGFLCKDLLIDWRWGETYFAQKLNDYDLSSNNGNWQWASGSGCDAVPYFRMFNPTLQAEKFDKNFDYIRKWVPEFGTDAYPKPIVDHKFAKERAFESYSKALK
ncbi:MAG: deoxyribodipyrimidine photo-lyase [Dysgonamonadaceae bacterium]|nr:deoxyribodipyrimidine photo-lyase [Dysgonamonadaceae bacterium]MDD3310351.1 deoxyribodipyrimidine photo-lyase [Dysgonamonadaceae bacterium]MDD4399134.1 deoxyribodipyrimidine photo-lyase [Dysgonamonadaceae bacterium]